MLHKILAEAKFSKDSKTIIKAPSTMLESTNVIGSGFDELNPSLGGYVSMKDTYGSQLLDLFPKVFVDTASIAVVTETSDDGVVNTVSEGALKPLIDGDFAVSNPTMTKFAETISISDEMLGDVSFMAEAINRKLLRRLKNKISDWIINTNLGSVGNLLDASALTAGTTGTKILDLLPAIYEDMLVKYGYTPNLFLTSIPEYAKAYIELSYADTFLEHEEVVFKPYRFGTNSSIMAIDTMMFPLYVLKDMTIEIGKNNNDFLYNRTSIRCEARLAFDLNAENKQAGYFDTIANTKAAIL